jgi:ParB-like chromosome segregation protein Spo0J
MNMSNEDELQDRAVAALRTCGRTHVSPEWFARKLGIGLRQASEVANRLIAAGILGNSGCGYYPVINTAPTSASPASAPLCADAAKGAVAATAADVTAEKIATDKTVELATGDLEVAADAEVRTERDAARVLDLAAAMIDGAKIDPIVVFKTPEGRLVVADGRYRLDAVREAGLKTVVAVMKTGTIRDAFLYAVRANAAQHALPLTRADRRAAVERLLADSEWSQWADAEIGRQTGVSNRHIGRIREELTRRQLDQPVIDNVNDRKSVTPKLRKCRTRQGTVRTVNTAEIGRRPRTPGAKADLSHTRAPADPLIDLLKRIEKLLTGADRPPGCHATNAEASASGVRVAQLLLAWARPVVDELTAERAPASNDWRWTSYPMQASVTESSSSQSVRHVRRAHALASRAVLGGYLGAFPTERAHAVSARPTPA